MVSNLFKFRKLTAFSFIILVTFYLSYLLPRQEALKLTSDRELQLRNRISSIYEFINDDTKKPRLERYMKEQDTIKIRFPTAFDKENFIAELTSMAKNYHIHLKLLEWQSTPYIKNFNRHTVRLHLSGSFKNLQSLIFNSSRSIDPLISIDQLTIQNSQDNGRVTVESALSVYTYEASQ